MTTARTAPFPASTILGYPRIGPHRELKRALEAYWAGRSTHAELCAVGRRLREATWTDLHARGLGALPSNTFSYYDQVLDTAILLGAVPDRYRRATNEDTGFAMARGDAGLAPLRMTKWFNTNYHYIVPEIGEDTPFQLDADKPVSEVREAAQLGLTTRPVLVGPLTFLSLAERAPGSPDTFTPLHRLDDVLVEYCRLLASLAAAGVEWVQLDEPVLVTDLAPAGLAAVRTAYQRLGSLTDRPALLVAEYFGDPGAALPALADTPIDAIGLDLVAGGAADLACLADKTVVAGVVSGRDVWRTDRRWAQARLAEVRDHAHQVVVGTSCSLLHVPYDLELEPDLDPVLRSRLAFAAQKVDEVVELADSAPAAGRPEPSTPTAPAEEPAPRDTIAERSPYPVRAAAQADHLRLPVLPVTTIGSFPQTGQLRAARAAVAGGRLPEADYHQLVRAEIERVVRLQERLGLDVLVHGEPERNDMVQYFAEHLDGFAVTRNGWVQSYGSRCTRPPILHSDVRRPEPITVGWSRYAQSLTDKPVKGMLTGPVTIVSWSFVRDDLPVRRVVEQVAEAVRDEVADLEAAGISIIQVDEPALREMMPLVAAEQGRYLDWAVAAYRLATSGASDRTQIHTHLCYSDAGQILDAIDRLDADVTTIESARSHAAILDEPAVRAFTRGLGPGVYDIHSPRVPPADELDDLLGRALDALPAGQVWVNPDCGLKTRAYPEVEAALAAIVTVVNARRATLAGAPT